MPWSHTRLNALLIAATALALTSCGSDGPPNEMVMGSVTGLSQSGLVLQFNGTSVPVPAGVTSEQFGSETAGSPYSVTVATQPTQEICTVTNGSGTVPRANVTVLINCTLNTYSIGGAITGLVQPGLVLLNNGADPTEVKPNVAAFSMNSPVTSGGAYAITIKSQPVGETCTLSGASGSDVLANVTTVAIQCAPWSSAMVTTLYSFTGATDGNHPSILFQGADSSFYGITSGTPYVSNGTVYQVTLAGSEATLYTFTGVLFGGPLPEGPNGPVQGADGNLYGTTVAGGGSANGGTFFKLDLTGSLTALHSFTGGSDAAVPTGRVLQGMDGNFYGTTSSGGGPNNNGAIFKISGAGAESVFFSMPPTYINAASAALVQARDGTIYYASIFNSTTPGGGTVYAVSPNGNGTPVYAFNGGSEGSQIGALLEGADGNLYGFTASGGAVGGGTIFKLTPAGALTTLHSFGNSNDGNTPTSLILADDGNFYGTTSKGGVSSFGTLFRITPAGDESVLYSFTGASGYGPTSLIQASDGNFYGLLGNGGVDGLGTIFKAVPH